MDHEKSPIRRQKRQSKVLEDNFWDCSVCTYRNTAEAFKCLMCDVRKGYVLHCVKCSIICNRNPIQFQSGAVLQRYAIFSPNRQLFQLISIEIHASADCKTH